MGPEKIKSDKSQLQENEVIPNSTKKHGLVLEIIGLLLVISATFVIWYFRATLTNLSPRDLKGLWYGMGGMALLYLVAALPLGAILLALGAARLAPTSQSARRVFLPLLGIELAYFIFHAIMAFRYASVPFPFFALMGCLVVGLFLTLVWTWAHKRAELNSGQQQAVDLQMAAGLCFINSAWQTCGLLGAPGFALYPDLIEKLDNHSFIIGQAVAIQIFTVLGFVFMLMAMRAEKSG